MPISPLSPPACHGVACSENRMSCAFHWTGQVRTCICPSPQSSLATGPRFIETWAVTAVGGYMTRKRGQVCVVPKLSRVTSSMQTLLPREKKLPINWDNHWTGEPGKMPTTEQGQWWTHVSDGCRPLFLNKLPFLCLKCSQVPNIQFVSMEEFCSQSYACHTLGQALWPHYS